MSEDIKKKGIVECLSDFMGDPEGLTKEDLITELKDQGIDSDRIKNEVSEFTVF